MKKILLILAVLCVIMLCVSCTGGQAQDDSSAQEDITSADASSEDTSVYVDMSDTLSDASDDNAIKDVSFSGTLQTDYTCPCNLFADVTAVSSGNNEVNVTVAVRLECRQISVSARNNLGKVTIGNEKYTFSTPAIENYESMVKTFEFVTQSRTVSRDENGDLSLAISVEWPFRGVYSGIEIDDMRISGSLVISGNGTVTLG